MVHPSVVCMEILFSVLSWTPSMMSVGVSFAGSLVKLHGEIGLTDLSKGGPWIRPKEPVRRPSTTARRHVLDIGNEQAMRIPIVADQPNRRSTGPTKREFVRSVDAESGGAVCGRDESVPFGYGSVDILDVSAGWIAPSVEVELVEEVLSRRVFIDQLIRRNSWCSVSVTEDTVWSALRRY
jgi:hypothetical protein